MTLGKIVATEMLTRLNISQNDMSLSAHDKISFGIRGVIVDKVLLKQIRFTIDELR